MSPALKETQIKSKMRYPYTANGKAKIKHTESIEGW